MRKQTIRGDGKSWKINMETLKKNGPYVKGAYLLPKTIDQMLDVQPLGFAEVYIDLGK